MLWQIRIKTRHEQSDETFHIIFTRKFMKFNLLTKTFGMFENLKNVDLNINPFNVVVMSNMQDNVP